MSLKISDLSVGGNIVYTGQVQKTSEDIARTISAQGSAVVSVASEIATLRFQSVHEAGKYKDVHDVLSDRASKVVSELGKHDTVLSVSTGNYSIYPYYTYSDGKSSFAGYRGTYSLNVECVLSGAGNIIDVIADLSVEFMIQNVAYKPTDAARSEALKEALRAATENALVSIDAALSGTKFTRSDVYQISVSQGGYVTRTESLDVAAKESTPIYGDDMNVNASVMVKALFV